MHHEAREQGDAWVPTQYIVEGGHRLTGTIEPSGNKNAALPIIAASLLTELPVTLNNVPRIRDTETLVELIRSVGAAAEWRSGDRLDIHAKNIRAAGWRQCQPPAARQ